MSTPSHSDGVTVSGESRWTGTLSTTDMCSVAGAIDDGVQGRSVPVSGLVARAGPTEAATHCTVIAGGGAYRASIPIADLAGKGWLSFTDVRESGTDHPAPPTTYRLTVAGGDTLCWNVKDVVELHFSVGPEPDDVPENPPH